MDIKFIGPEGQINYALAEEVGSAVPVPEMVYTVSVELGTAIVDSSSMWVEYTEEEE